jgi:hypothetical protein
MQTQKELLERTIDYAKKVSTKVEDFKTKRAATYLKNFAKTALKNLNSIPDSNIPKGFQAVSTSHTKKKRQRANNNSPGITIDKYNATYINKTTLNLFGSAKKCALLFDPEHKIVAIKPLHTESGLRISKKECGASICFTGFLKHFKLTPKVGVFYPGIWDTEHNMLRIQI